MKPHVKGTIYPRMMITLYGAIDSKLKLENYESDKVIYYSKKIDDYHAYLDEMMKVFHNNLGSFSKESEKLIYIMKMNRAEEEDIQDSSLRSKRRKMNIVYKNHELVLQLLVLKNEYTKKRDKLIDQLNKEEKRLQVYLIHYTKGMNLGSKKNNIEVPRLNYKEEATFITFKSKEDFILGNVDKEVDNNEEIEKII